MSAMQASRSLRRGGCLRMPRAVSPGIGRTAGARGFHGIHSTAQALVEPPAGVVEALDLPLGQTATEVVFLHRDDLLLKQRVERA
jgi:hypothetical protein